MSIVLPGELDWVLDLLGFEWPNLDEDLIMQAAQEWLDFGQAARDYQEQGNRAAELVRQAHGGDAADAFLEQWSKFSENGLGIGGAGIGYLDGLAGAGDVLGVMLDVAGVAVVALKIYVIVQLIDLAIEFAIAQASAPVTLGASEAALAGRVAMIRFMVKRALTEAAQKIEQEVLKAVREKAVIKTKEMAVDLAKDLGKDIAKSVASELGTQGIKQAFGAGEGWEKNLASLGVSAANPVLGKVAGELEKDDDGNGYHLETKAGGKVVEGAIDIAHGDVGGLQKMTQGSGELFDNVTAKKGEESGSGEGSGSGSGEGSGTGSGSGEGSGSGSGSDSDETSGSGSGSGASQESGSGSGSGTTSQESGSGSGTSEESGSGSGTSEEPSSGSDQESGSGDGAEAAQPEEPRQGSANNPDYDKLKEGDRVRTVFG